MLSVDLSLAELRQFNWKTKETNSLQGHRAEFVCVECLIGKQKKPILFKVTEPSSIPYRTHSACAKRAADPDPPPVIPVDQADSDKGLLGSPYSHHGIL